MKDKIYYFAHPYSYNGKFRFFARIIRYYRHKMCNKRSIKLLNRGFVIFSPITHSYPLEKTVKNSHEYWIKYDTLFMEKCDALILAPNWEKSRGCRMEREWFVKNKKPVFLYNYFI